MSKKRYTISLPDLLFAVQTMTEHVNARLRYGCGTGGDAQEWRKWLRADIATIRRLQKRCDAPHWCPIVPKEFEDRVRNRHHDRVMKARKEKLACAA